MTGEKSRVVEFQILAGALIVVPVELANGVKARFALDTGAGIDVVSKRLANELSLPEEGTFTGKRMTGEEITVGLTKVPSLSFAGSEKTDYLVGVTDIFDKLPKELGSVDGALSMRFFADTQVKIDFPKSLVELGPKAIEGYVVPLKKLRQKDLALGLLAPITIDGRYGGEFEVDTGTTTTIAPLRAMETLGLSKDDKSLRKVEGVNETGVPFQRFYGKAKAVYASGQSETMVTDSPICFEEVIYDGVIGIDYLQNFSVIFDLRNSQMFLAAK